MYTQFLVHITEAMHKWQFIKKSSTAATPQFFKDPHHKKDVKNKKRCESQTNTCHGCIQQLFTQKQGLQKHACTLFHVFRSSYKKKRNILSAQA